MSKLYNEIKDELLNHITPYWKNLLDKKYGGFYGDVDYHLNVYQNSDKSGLSLSRYLYAFSALHNSGLDSNALIYADSAYEFLVNHLLDQVNGGIFFLTDHKGTVKVDYKHTYIQAFFIYGLSEYYKATKKEEVKNLAMQTFQTIEQKMFDKKHQGYLEEFDKNFNLKNNELTSEHGITAYFTTNTHLHILEAYTSLYEITGNQKVKNRILFLLDLFETKIKKENHYQVFFNEKFNSILNSVSFGHDIETTWLIDKAYNTIQKEYSYNKELLSIVDNSLKQINGDGSLTLEIINEEYNQNRIWWCQAEAMVGFYNAYQQTNNKKYLETVKGLWEYTKQNMIDSRPNSEWFWELDSSNKPIHRNITEIWKTPYHNVRFCLELIERTS